MTIEQRIKRLEDAVFQPESNDFVVINGLKWDRENLIIEDRQYLNWYEALGAAAVAGKRLPTQEEFEALVALGSTWDDDLKGRWFGYDHELKSASKQSIFLSAAGYRNRSDGELHNVDTLGLYWSSTSSGIFFYRMSFYRGSASSSNTNHYSNCLAVHCVAEL